MATNDLAEFRVDDECLEVSDQFVLLIDKEGYCSREVKRRLQLGKAAMANLTKIMKDSEVPTQTKIRMARAMLSPVVTYGFETWIMRKYERRRLSCARGEEFRVPLTARVTNAAIIECIKPTCSLGASVAKSKLWPHLAGGGVTGEGHRIGTYVREKGA